MSDTYRPREHDDRRVVRWLESGPRSARQLDRRAVLAKTLQQVPATFQRRRWWWRGSNGPARDVTRTATPGSSLRTGRSRTMWSASSLTIGAAVMALAATSVLITQQAEPSEPMPAGATQAVEVEASTFAGTRASVPEEMVAGTRNDDAGITRNRGTISNGIAVESSDERFSGTLDFTMHEDKYGRAGVFWGEQMLSNDEGSWEGTLVGAGDPMVGKWRASNHMIGSGAYEGLVAIVFFDSDLTHQGVILPGPLPPRE